MTPQVETHRRGKLRRAGQAVVLVALIVGLSYCDEDGTGPGDRLGRRPLDPELVAQGREIFRYDTFGDEAYWTDTARMHEVIEGAVSPALALQVGLKVDADALPQEVKEALAAGQVDLGNPATTVALLKLNAVVGLKGTVEARDGEDRLVRVGITCALCHSTVDNSFAPGIGKRLDGWPNGDLDVGVIVALSPAIPPPLRGLWQHPPYFHDGSAETLEDVVAHYDRVLKLNLSTLGEADLVEYLKTL